MGQKEGEEGLDTSELAAHKKAQRELERVLEIEEIMWHQKSRIQWMKECDHNTKFFHWMASIRRSMNYIYNLIIGGELVDNVDDMQTHIENYFKALF